MLLPTANAPARGQPNQPQFGPLNIPSAEALDNRFKVNRVQRCATVTWYIDLHNTTKADVTDLLE